jgi:hypothetical protein
VRIQDFSLDQVLSAAQLHSDYDVALIFSTKYEVRPGFWDRWLAFAQIKEKWKHRFFGYHRDLAPPAAAGILGGKIVYSGQRRGQWIAIIERRGEAQGIEEAKKISKLPVDQYRLK